MLKEAPNPEREEKLIALLLSVEEASRPITFETLDVILTNHDADSIVKQLTGITVTMDTRNKLAAQLDGFLKALEKLAQFWGIVKAHKYLHRSKQPGLDDQDMILIPYNKKNAPFLSSQSLLSSCVKPFAISRAGKSVSVAGKEFFQHAASLQVHFYELTALVKHLLGSRRQPVSQEQTSYGILSAVMSIFSSGASATSQE